MTQTQTEYLGSVIEASIVRFVAQSVRLNQTPPLGTLVRIADGGLVIYGVVAGAVTDSIDPGRRPYIRDGVVPRDADAYLDENPHLAYLYRTCFEAIVVGHERDGVLCHYLPPTPARLYAPVAACSDRDVGAFWGPSPWDRLDFLPLLLAGPGEARDDVVAAFIRRGAQATGAARELLIAAGKALTVLLANDPARLNGILRRVKP